MLADTRGPRGGMLLGMEVPEHPKSACKDVALSNRIDCGFIGINASSCAALQSGGCCFAQSRNGPACYRERPLLASSATPYFYPAFTFPDDKATSSLNVTQGSWSHIGLSVTRSADHMVGTLVEFFINGAQSAPLRIEGPTISYFDGDVMKLARFVGSLRVVGSFPGKALTLKEHNAWANQYAASLSLPTFRPAASEIPVPALLMDAARGKYAISANWLSSGSADATNEVKALDDKTLLFCGTSLWRHSRVPRWCRSTVWRHMRSS